MLLSFILLIKKTFLSLMVQVFPRRLREPFLGTLESWSLPSMSLTVWFLLVSSEPVPIKQQGCASLSANDKAAAGLSLIRPAPALLPNRKNFGRRKAPSPGWTECNSSFILPKQFSQSRGKAFERPAKVLSG